MEQLNVFLSLGAGFLSFISPCCLPLYPAFLSYITGMSVEQLKQEKMLFQKHSLIHAVLFLVGFSSIFIAMGYASSLFGGYFIQYQDTIRRIGSLFIIFFGLIILGVFQPKFLMKDYRISFKNRPAGYIGTIIIGAAFAAGWMPCTGPILASVLYLATTNPTSSFLYMISYIIGFSIPFLLLSFFIGKFVFLKQNSFTFMKIGGTIMIVMGIILFFDLLTSIIKFFSVVFGGFTGF